MISITGGRFRGHPIQTPVGQATRPSLAKVRQALFNSLQAQVIDAVVADLFAGSGALGLEALSRGASKVVFVESSKDAVNCIRKNLDKLKIDPKHSNIFKHEIITQQKGASKKGDHESFDKLVSAGPFDLVFADPPYEDRVGLEILEMWDFSKILNVDGLFILEWDPKKGVFSELPEKIGSLVKIREKTYGDTWLTHFQLA